MMDDTALPPLPQPDERGPRVCATMRLYLAVLDDLSPEQRRAVLAHVHTCADCAREYRLLGRATQLVGSLGESAPSARVDAAVMEAIAARYGRPAGSETSASRPLPHLRPLPAPDEDFWRPRRQLPRRRRMPDTGRRVLATLVAAAVILLLIGAAAIPLLNRFMSSAQGITLPADLSWSGYVLYYDQTKVDPSGRQYSVVSYHNLGTGQMRVETSMPGSLDVVAVGTHQKMLGLDMMHHVAQWGADAWGPDDSAIDLPQLRGDLQSGRAVYLGKGSYSGQDVYRIRTRSGEILLLDMHYMPVMVLSSSGKPMHDILKMLPASQVPAYMWNTTIPPGWKMGTLPPPPGR